MPLRSSPGCRTLVGMGELLVDGGESVLYNVDDRTDASGCRWVVAFVSGVFGCSINFRELHRRDAPLVLTFAESSWDCRIGSVAYQSAFLVPRDVRSPNDAGLISFSQARTAAKARSRTE